MTAKRNPQGAILGEPTRNHRNIPAIAENPLKVKSCAVCLNFLPVGGGLGAYLRGQCLRTAEFLNAPTITGCDLWRPATKRGVA